MSGRAIATETSGTRRGGRRREEEEERRESDWIVKGSRIVVVLIGGPFSSPPSTSQTVGSSPNTQPTNHTGHSQLWKSYCWTKGNQ